MAKKPQKITFSQLPFYCWKYEEQTATKHRVFIEYFDRWVKILGKYNRLNYFDCYGGCGAYADNDRKIFYGSPIEAARIISNNQTSLDRDVNLVVIEKFSDVLENLKKVFNHVIPNANPYFINEDFDNTINNLLDKLQRKGTTLAPTFFLVDPFGYSIKMDTIKRIMEVPKSEVFINFMYYRINMSMSNPQEEENITNLFGTSKWKELVTLKPKEKEKKILRLYRKQIKEFSNYFYPYKLNFPDKNRTYYYLIHLTNHFKGCSIMKSAFAKYNDGRLAYLGVKGKDQSIFDLQDYKIGVIVEYFRRDCWKNKRLSFDQIIAAIIDKTPFLEKHIKAALKKMIKDNEITRIPITSKTGTGLQKDDIIYFVESKNENH